MRVLALVAAAAAGSLLDGALPDASTLLTIPQQDHLRSRMSPASASVSADGRYIALISYARLTPDDADALPDVYVFDHSDGRLVLASTAPGDGRASFPRLSANGRYVAYEEVLPSPEAVTAQLVIRDLSRGTVTRLKEAPARGWTGSGALSEDGVVVAFESSFTDLVAAPDENGESRDIYILNTASGVIVRASVDTQGRQQPRGESSSPSVSGTGRFVVFTSTADLHTAKDRNTSGKRESSSPPQIYLRDSQLNVTRSITGGRGGQSISYAGVISRDARFVAFVSEDAGLADGDRNRAADVFLHDLVLGSTMLVSRSASGGSGNGASRHPAISSDGRFVAFQSDASDLVCAERCRTVDEDINLLPDIFLFDRLSSAIRRVSADTTAGWMEESVAPAISGDGSLIAFSSRHPIDALDVENDFDLFVWVAETRGGRSIFARVMGDGRPCIIASAGCAPSSLLFPPSINRLSVRPSRS